MKPDLMRGLPRSAFAPHKPIPPDHVALVRKAAIIAGAQLHEQPLSRSDFDERIYGVHLRREDGRYVCSTLPPCAMCLGPTRPGVTRGYIVSHLRCSKA
jgi:hypothetical protein